MNKPAKPDAPGAHDIFFECPSCGKSLVVEARAAGLIVPCPKCSASVIVPPHEHAHKPAAKPVVVPMPVTVPVPAKLVAPVPGSAVPEKLAALLHQLKEMQTQRTEIGNRVASHLNEVTRDLVALSRLDATQQQLVAEWAQVVAALDAPVRAASLQSKSPAKPGL